MGGCESSRQPGVTAQEQGPNIYTQGSAYFWAQNSASKYVLPHERVLELVASDNCEKSKHRHFDRMDTMMEEVPGSQTRMQSEDVLYFCGRNMCKAVASGTKYRTGGLRTTSI